MAAVPEAVVEDMEAAVDIAVVDIAVVDTAAGDTAAVDTVAVVHHHMEAAMTDVCGNL